MVQDTYGSTHRAVGDKLADHGVVVDADIAALNHGRVDTDVGWVHPLGCMRGKAQSGVEGGKRYSERQAERR